MKTLYLKFHGPTTFAKEGYYEPHTESQMSEFKHFSGGMIKISKEKLDELVEVAKIHGWQVIIKREAGKE